VRSPLDGESLMPVEECQNCHGNGTVQKEKIVDGKSVWTTEKCPAGCRNGKVDRKLI
jgi:DnaJ-class molecular chaperone